MVDGHSGSYATVSAAYQKNSAQSYMVDVGLDNPRVKDSNFEDISRRVYSPLPGRPRRRRTLKIHACAPLTTDPPAPMIVEGSTSGPSVGRLSRRNDAQQRDTMLTNDKYPRWSASLLSPGPQLCLVSQKILSIYKTTPSPSRQASGIARYSAAATGSGNRMQHPADLPKGYHTAAQGQSYTAHTPVPSRAAPGPPRGRTASGRRDATRTPTYKICNP